MNRRRPRVPATAIAAALVLALVSHAGLAQAGALPSPGTGLLSLAGGGQLDFQLAVNPNQPIPTLTPEESGLHITPLPGPGANYRLTVDSNLAAADPNPTPDTVPQVILDVTNKGQIAPPLDSKGMATISPLTILGTSSGLDQNHLLVGLKEVPGSDGGTKQMLGLSFVNLLPAPTPPTPPAPPVDTPAPPVNLPPNQTGHNTVPEPATIALWSALAVGGLLRARAFRRSRAANV